MEAQVVAPDDLRSAVAALSQQTGLVFVVSDRPVPGTNLYVVYAANHPFSSQYNQEKGTLGFRVPGNFPDAGPEDSFFIMPESVKLKEADPVRQSTDINRASPDPNHLQTTIPVEGVALVFSWHLWNKKEWNRRKHALIDHYTHSLRRFEQPEHD
jgi:hypothetical protein